jgi:hypothetical protein
MHKKSKWTRWFVYGITAVAMLLTGLIAVFAPPQQFDVIVDVTASADGIRTEFTAIEGHLPASKIEIQKDGVNFITWTESESQHRTWWSDAADIDIMKDAKVTFETELSKIDLAERFDFMPLAVNQHEPIKWTCDSKQFSESSWFLTCKQN